MIDQDQKSDLLATLAPFLRSFYPMLSLLYSNEIVTKSVINIYALPIFLILNR